MALPKGRALDSRFAFALRQMQELQQMSPSLMHMPKTSFKIIYSKSSILIRKSINDSLFLHSNGNQEKRHTRIKQGPT